MGLEVYETFICGGAAALVETVLVFPLHKTSFRQQLHGISIRSAFAQIHHEGVFKLYRGVLPPLLQKSVSRSLMFGMYEKFIHLFKCQNEAHFTTRHATAAFMAGSVEALLCPFERVQVILQTTKYHDELRNTQHAFAVLRTYGLTEYYRAFTMVAFRNGTSNILFFASRDHIRDFVLRFYPSSSSSGSVSTPFRTFTADFISGAVLGASLSTIFFPLNVVRTRMQSKLGGPFDSFSTVLALIWRERNRSLIEFYLGGRLNYTRSLLSWGITNSVFGYLQANLFHDTKKLS